MLLTLIIAFVYNDSNQKGPPTSSPKNNLNNATEKNSPQKSKGASSVKPTPLNSNKVNLHHESEPQKH